MTDHLQALNREKMNSKLSLEIEDLGQVEKLQK